MNSYRHSCSIPHRISFFLLVVCMLLATPAFTQIDTLDIKSQTFDIIEIKNNSEYYIENGHEKSLKDIFIKADFMKYDWLKRDLYRNNTVWVKFCIKNSLTSDTLKFKGYFGKQLIRGFYSQNGNHNLVYTDLKQIKFSDSGVLIPVIIPPQNVNTYWVRIEKFIFFNNREGYLFPFERPSKLAVEREFQGTKLFAFVCMVIGLFFFTGLIALFQAFFTKDKTYGFWAMYLFINALFFAAELNRAFGFGFMNISKFNRDNDPLPWPTAIQFVVSILYLMFISSFLEIRQQSQRIYNFIRIAVKVMLVGLVLALFAVVAYDYELTIYADMFLVVTNLLILLTVIYIIRSKIPQKNMLMIGSIGVLLAATISVVVEITEIQDKVGFWLIPIVCYGVGSVWELACFSLALSQRSRLIQLENQQLQKNYTSRLELELSQRLDVIQTQDKLLEEQRINTLTTEFEQKIAETEITALRSQMNPHFIFNCLNSIKLYSLENDSESASIYLTKFSKLIRLVLDNSRSERLTLEKEIETLRLYIEMEIMRFKEKVTYEMNISPEIDQQYVEIPPLLIQPFVENAIWHGLMHKELGGKVSILVNLLEENMLEIQIIDNGVGREKSAEYKSKTATKHKSFGMKVTNERIDLINQIYKTKAKVEIIDLYDSNQIGIGTKVIIQIPI
ncbi:MAG: histidine kinase [Leadbetterella sp.]|nr:histidine kinase [Leadbetterella sp.]